MPIYSVQGPDGHIYDIEGPEGATESQVISALQDHLDSQPPPAPAPEKKKGIGAAASRGLESLISATRTGAGVLTGDANEAATAGAQRSKDLDDKYEQQYGLDKIKDVYHRDGLLSAAGEALHEVPYAIAENAPALGSMVGGGVAGRVIGGALGSLAGPVGTAVGSTVGGAAGAFLPDFVQRVGGNAERQAAVQQSAGQPVNVNTGAAAAAAVPQTAIDAVDRLLPLGGTMVSKLTGIPARAFFGATAETAARMAEERMLTTLAKGTGTMVAVGVPSQVAQAMLERAQAGLPLATPDALQEYGQAATGATLMAPMGAAGRFLEKAHARGMVADQEDAARAGALQEQEQAKQQDAAELAARQQSPEYAADVTQRYQTLQAQMDTLMATVKAGRKGDFAAKQAAADAWKTLNELKKDPANTDLAREYSRMRAQQGAQQTTAPQPQPAQAGGVGSDAGFEERKLAADTQRSAQETAAQGPQDLFGAEPIQPTTPMPQEDAQRERVELANRLQTIKSLLDAHQQQESDAAGAGDLDRLAALRQRRTQLRTEYEGVSKLLEAKGGPPIDTQSVQAQIDKIKQQIVQSSGAGYDPDKVDKLHAKLQELQKQLGAAADQGSFELKPTKPQRSESTESFNTRTYEPGGYEKPQDANGANLDLFDEQSRDLDEQRKEGQTAKEISDVEKQARMPTGVQEQGTLFGDETRSEVVSGAGAPHSRNELLSALQIARAAGDRTAASQIVESLRDLASREQARRQEEPAGAASPLDNPTAKAFGSTIPDKERQLSAARDQRAAAYAQLVQTIEKFNRGAARQGEVNEAKQRIIDGLQREAELARGAPLEDAQRRMIGVGADKMLRELIQRWGDTRGLTNLGTRKEPEFEPAQYANGVWNRYGKRGEGPGMMGFPNEEQAMPGRQTFGNRFAAAQSIYEGLNELRNKAAATGMTSVERKVTPSKVSPEMLRTQIERDRTKLPPEARKLADEAEAQWPALSNAPELVEDVSKHLYSAATAGKVDPREQQRLTTELGELEKGKRGEVPDDFGIPHGVQKDLFPRMAEAFDTPKQFWDFMASDGLRMIRSAQGLLGPNVERTQRLLHPVREKIDSLAKKLTDAHERFEALEKQRDDATKLLGEERTRAQAKHEADVRAARSIMADAATAVDRETFAALSNFRNAYLRHAFTKQVVEQLREQIERAKERFDTPIKGLEQRYAQELKTVEGWLREQRAPYFEQLRQVVSQAREVKFTHKQLLDAVKDIPTPERAKVQQLLKLRENIERARDKRIDAWMSAPRVKEMLTELSALEDQLRAERPVLASHVSALKRTEATLEKARREAPSSKELDAAHALLDEVKGEIEKKSETVQTAERILAEARDKAAPLTKEMQALSEQMRPLVEQVRRIEKFTNDRAEARTKKPEGQPDHSAKDKALVEEQATLEKHADEPRTAVSFDKARKLEAKRDRAGVERRDLEEEAATAPTPEARVGAQEELDRRREAVEKTTENATKRQAGAMKREAALVAKLAQTEDPTRRADLQRQLDDVRSKLSAMRGVEKTPVKTREDIAAERRAQYERDTAEHLARVKRGEDTGTLPARKVGPVTKKAQQAGTIRTGEAATAGERKVGMRNPVEQAGRPRPLTSLQAQRAANKDTEKQALTAKQVHLENLQQKVETAVEDAREALANAKTAAERTAAKALLARREEQLARVEQALDKVAQQAEDAAPMAVKTRTQRLDEATRAFEEGDEDHLLQTAATATQGPRVAVEHESNAGAVMHKLSQQTSSPVARAVAERLKMLLGNTRIELVDDLHDRDGTPAYGMASADGTRIRLDARFGANEQTVLHEGVHAAVERALRLPEEQLSKDQLAAKRELQALYDAYLKDADGPSENARKSLSEFVAEALSDPALQEHLRATPWTLKNMWNGVKNGILKMLGVDVPRNQLEATLAAADSLMQRVARPDASLLKTEPTYVLRPKVAPAWKGVSDIGERAISRDRPFYERMRNNAAGLRFETKLVDRFAALERTSKLMEPLHGSQMMFWARMYDQRMHHVAESVGTGVTQRVEITRGDGRKEWVLEAKQGGASLRSVVQALRPAAKIIGSGDAVNRAFTMYMSAKRAENKGLQALNFKHVTEADMQQVRELVNATPEVKSAFEAARREYNAYNRDLLKLLVDSGAIHKDVAAKLLREDDYIPWYRERNGNAILQIGSEAPVTVGSLKHQPYLKDLVGGDAPIMDFMTSSVQNTNMIIDMALRNLATKDAVFKLQDIGLAHFLRGETTGPDIVNFKDDGVDKYARIETDSAGIPAQLLVEGMNGVPTQPTGVLKALGLPARVLRKAVTASPLYMARQLFRDSLAAPMLSGADMTPVLSALAQIGKTDKLSRRGITGGQVFTGGKEDLSAILRRVSEGKSGFQSALSWLEAKSMQADALTRHAQFESYRKQGLSEMEATLMSLESMNFSKRGASPSVWMINSVIPFFNAQIQGLNVLYKAATGKMPFNDRLRIREKFIARGMLMMGTSLAYAAAMQDDDAYKNATPDQKYGNWFIRVPGFDEPVKLPVPFEVGYIFKSIPEALYNMAANDHAGDEALKAFGTILTQTIPGGTSYGIPQAVKPAIEFALGKSFYTGRDMLTRREQLLTPEAQYRADTSELAKAAAQLGVSPIKFENLVRGYFGTLGAVALHAGDPFLAAGTSPEQATKRWSDMPLVGGVFQPNDAGGIINPLYDQMLEYKRVKESVDTLLKRGEKAEAMALLNARGADYARSQMAENFSGTMTKFTQAETAIRASTMSPDDKRAALDRVRQAKIRFSTAMRAAVDRTTPQAPRP